MSTLNRRQLFQTSATAALAIGSTACGWVLYPERKGNQGNIDTLPFVVDLLWLLPGLVPGVICLIVDFTTGCIYRGGGSAENAERDTSALAVVILDGKTVAKSTIDAEEPTRLTLAWNKGVDLDAVRERGVLVFTRKDGIPATALMKSLA